MNRSERRRKGITRKDPVRVVKESDMLLNQDRIKQVTTQYVTDIVMAVTINALHAEYGFGQGRLQRVINEINGQIMAVADGNVSAQEVMELAASFGLKNVFSHGRDT